MALIHPGRHHRAGVAVYRSDSEAGVAASAARSGVVTLLESAPQETSGNIPAAGLSAAAKKAMPSVVNIFTSTVIKTRSIRSWTTRVSVFSSATRATLSHKTVPA